MWRSIPRFLTYYPIKKDIWGKRPHLCLISQSLHFVSPQKRIMSCRHSSAAGTGILVRVKVTLSGAKCKYHITIRFSSIRSLIWSQSTFLETSVNVWQLTAPTQHDRTWEVWQKRLLQYPQIQVCSTGEEEDWRLWLLLMTYRVWILVPVYCRLYLFDICHNETQKTNPKPNL